MSDNSLETKSFGAFEIKDADAGEVCAVVATLGVVDREGDVLLPGSFPDSPAVKMSAYNHNVITEDAVPVGKGTIRIEGDRAIFRGRYFMSSERGREAFAVVKEMGSDSEWSFAWRRSETKTLPMTDEWRTKGARRLISGIPPAMEASPVFIGAGLGTGTLYMKAKEDDPPPPDPAIEAARLETERQAQELAAINARADQRFKRSRMTQPR